MANDNGPGQLQGDRANLKVSDRREQTAPHPAVGPEKDDLQQVASPGFHDKHEFQHLLAQGRDVRSWQPATSTLEGAPQRECVLPIPERFEAAPVDEIRHEPIQFGRKSSQAQQWFEK